MITVINPFKSAGKLTVDLSDGYEVIGRVTIEGRFVDALTAQQVVDAIMFGKNTENEDEDIEVEPNDAN